MGNEPLPLPWQFTGDDTSREGVSNSGREHGGGLDAAALTYGWPRDNWLDLSTGVNPNPYPLPALAPDLWRRLPDQAMMDNLCRVAAGYGIPTGEIAGDGGSHVVPAPGSQALIQCLPRLVPPTRVTILAPTYNEHAPAWRAAGHKTVEVAGLETVADDAAVVVVVNPNNPDGRIVAPLELLRLGEDRLLVVDEAFADAAPEISMAPAIGRCNVVVLRSFGKFFGLAGLRLGFALAGELWAVRLREAFGPWAVSGPAAAIGAAALADDDWIHSTRELLRRGAQTLDALLARHGLTVVGGTDLFRLVEHTDAEAVFTHLARAGILTRRFAFNHRWLRLGLPGSAAAFERLENALAGWGG